MGLLSVSSQLLFSLLLLQKDDFLVNADEYDHRYAPGDKVNLWVNKVGPYANPQEAYEYYSLPYCAPQTEHESETFNKLKAHSIGERLGGHALRHSGHDLIFASGDKQTVVEECNTEAITEAQAAAFTKAAEDQWFYQMYIDDLPVWGMVGEMLPDYDDANVKKLGIQPKKDGSESDLQHLDEVVGKNMYGLSKEVALKPYVYTYRYLSVSYNKDRIVKVDLTSDPSSLVEVKTGADLNFKLFIKWESTDEEFHSRFDRYLDHAFFKHQIHWFSIFNSFMMVLFLMGLVALILLRTLRKDYARYALTHSHGSDLEEGEEGDAELDENGKPLLDHEGHPAASGGMPGEDSGWKQVHGDVFRAPQFLILFASIIGTGWQLITLTLGVILFAVAGPLHGEVHEERGEVLHAIITCFVLSSVVAGYSSGSFFKSYHATSPGGARSKAASAGNASAQWQATMGLTVLLLPTITVTILSMLNTVSLYYGTINTIPFLVILKLFAIWIFVSVPLTIFGTLLGRHAKLSPKGKGDLFPCRVNAIPRPIPEDVAPYGKPMNLIPFAGLLSFGSIFIELYYLLTSLWNYKFYHVYGFLLGVYFILIIVVSMTTIIVVYFCLNAENYLWQWTAFASGASMAVYVFIYGVFFFFFKTNMNGFLQTAFYFGYMGLIALNLGTLCGTIGHFAASRFVRAIFQNVKVD
mmetsp:Transcript_14292/g.19538  ORF Transcript_14292/g.19538 Transcript_14292/m.19538 type:complete len:693 (-) Transcript_14292:269-2347(-)